MIVAEPKATHKTTKGRPAAFVPAATEAKEAPRSGRRRVPLSSVCLPLLWPTTMSERRKSVRLWRRIAMIMLQDSDKVMRLPAIVPDVLIWTDGEIWASNWKLSLEAGGCAEKTMQREIEWFRLRGLLQVTYGWKRNKSGHLSKTRLMKLGIPSDYTGQIPDLDEPDQADTRGPDGDTHQADTRGPDRMDTRGPITVEENDRLMEDDDAA